jgi:Protein of unknown function (DUF2934)
MARKTTGTGSTRRKKTVGSVQPATVQGASEVPKNGNSTNVVPFSVPVNVEEEIRRRAYELYLERRATAGDTNGNENQDWLIAEREILSRIGGHDHHA